MTAKPEAEARKIATTLREKVEFLRQEAAARGERVETLTQELLLSRIMGQTSKSPFFFMQSWGNASPGGSATYTAHVHNPDPSGYSGFSLFGYLVFGPANFIGSTDVALTTIDERFPHYYQRCGVAAGADASMTFTIDVRAGIRPGIYIGNCFLVQRDAFDVGNYIDRAAFDLTVT
jgi:hypothetical protein